MSQGVLAPGGLHGADHPTILSNVITRSPPILIP